MGEVWLARHRMLVRPAAVKLIRQEVASAEVRGALMERFEREAEATAAL
ncbi:MAG: serine/threonine protein kinase, partial [Deltaproteobacteria bacterium]|nr:serine/threonine protein kinase [Deltaproteobacteria bacterium]